jgi:hypothetical protein
MGAIIEGSNAHVFCDDCGKDLTVVTMYGMFCEDMCGHEKSLEASKAHEQMIKGILSRLG